MSKIKFGSAVRAMMHKKQTECLSQVHQFRAQFEIVIIEGIARTQSPTNKNDAVELPTFGVITGVNLT